MRFLLIKAVEEAHGYSQFVNSLHRALAELGHDAVVSDQSVHVVNRIPDARPLALELQAGRYDVALSFSSFFGSVRLDNDASLFDALGVKFLGWQLDHPIYAPESLGRGLNNRYSVYSNHNHQRFAEAIRLPGRGATLLPGGDEPDEPPKDFHARDWPIFIAASWNGVPQRLWEETEDSHGKALLVGVLDRLLAHTEASLLDAFNAASADLGFGATLGEDPAFDDLMVSFLRDPLTYVRHHDRISVIQGLADAGFPLTICGPGWRDFLGDRPHVTYLDRWIDFKSLPALYGNARIVINLNAGNGGCERAIHSAIAGAAVVSDYSARLADQFCEPDSLAFFDRARPGHVVETVGRLLESDLGETVAQRGRRMALDSSLWRHRAQQIVDFVGQG